MNSDEGCWWYLNISIYIYIISDAAVQGPLAGNFSGTSRVRRVASWKTWFWQLEPLHRIRSWFSSTNYNKQRRKGLWPCRALPEALTNTIIYYISNVHQSHPYILSCQWHLQSSNSLGVDIHITQTTRNSPASNLLNHPSASKSNSRIQHNPNPA